MQAASFNLSSHDEDGVFTHIAFKFSLSTVDDFSDLAVTIQSFHIDLGLFIDCTLNKILL